MKTTFAALLTTCVVAIGCGDEAAKPVATPAPPAQNSTSTAPVPPPDFPVPTDIKMPGDMTATPPTTAAATAPAVPAAAPDGFTPVAVEAGIVKLSSDNTTLQIIGRHAPPRGGPNDPMARTIVFEKFTGQLLIDPATKLPKSASAEIDATSLVAFDPRLTSHLKNNEFIDVEVHPTIKFESTRVELSTEAGKATIVGNLTLHGVTKEVQIPVSVTSGTSGATVHGEVTLNRREFNINHQAIDSRTMPEIDFTISVGKKTEPPTAGGRRNRRGQ